MYSNRTGNEKLAVLLNRNFASTEAMNKKQGKPGQKYLETIVLFKKGLNLLRSAKLVSSLIFKLRITDSPWLFRCFLVFTARLLRDNVLKVCKRRRILKRVFLFNSTLEKRRLIFKMIFTVEKLLQVHFSFSSHY